MYDVLDGHKLSAAKAGQRDLFLKLDADPVHTTPRGPTL